MPRETPRNLPITRPCLDRRERELLLEPLRSGWLVQGPQVARFEQMVAQFCGARHAVATSSCTTALHLALLAAGVGPGHEVIVPSFTYVATANAVEYCGARPVFADIDLDTFNLDPRQVEERLSARTVAVLPVHLFGLPADMESLAATCRRAGVAIVEDCACSLGAYLGGRHTGTFGLAGCFSFHPRKCITTGEGGMIVTDDAALAGRVRRLRDHGAAKSDLARHHEGGTLLPEFNELGYNYRLTDLQGALGVAQMEKLPRILAERRALAARYDELLSHLSWLKTPPCPQGSLHAYQSYVCLVRAEEFGGLPAANLFRNRLMAWLEGRGIACRQGTHAVHTLGYYRAKYGLTDNDCPHALAAERLSIALPLFVGMRRSDQQRVAAELGRGREEVLRSLEGRPHAPREEGSRLSAEG